MRSVKKKAPSPGVSKSHFRRRTVSTGLHPIESSPTTSNLPNSAAQRFEIHLEIAASDIGTTAPALLAQAANLSMQKTKEAMSKGAAWLSRGRHTRRLRRHKARLQAGDRLHLYFDPTVLAQAAPEPTLIADEHAYSVWYKPYGLHAQGSKWGDHTTLARWVELHLQPERPAFIVHRLDRAASGLMLLAHGKATARQLAALFQNREIGKRYQVIVHGVFPDKPEELTINSPLDAKPAVSHVRRLDTAPDQALSLLEVRIETGRKHQIRRHLAGNGYPVLGDRLYGIEGDQEDLALAAVSLSFCCPITGARRRYELSAASRPRLTAVT